MQRSAKPQSRRVPDMILMIFQIRRIKNFGPRSVACFFIVLMMNMFSQIAILDETIYMANKVIDNSCVTSKFRRKFATDIVSKCTFDDVSKLRLVMFEQARDVLFKPS